MKSQPEGGHNIQFDTKKHGKNFRQQDVLHALSALSAPELSVLLVGRTIVAGVH